MYDPIGYVNNSYPTSFVIGNNYNGNGYAYDMEQLFHKLQDCGVKCEFFYDRYESGTEPGHGYLSNLKNDKLADMCYTAMMKFLGKGDEKFIDGVGDKGVPNSPQESRIRLKSPCLQLDQRASNVI